MARTSDVGVPAVAAARRTASPSDADALFLTEIYYRDQSAAETARLLQIPSGTVRSRTFYGVRTPRRALAAGDAAA